MSLGKLSEQLFTKHPQMTASMLQKLKSRIQINQFEIVRTNLQIAFIAGIYLNFVANISHKLSVSQKVFGDRQLTNYYVKLPLGISLRIYCICSFYKDLVQGLMYK